VALRSTSCVNLKSVLADALRTRKDLKAERRRASLRLRPRCRRDCRASAEREYSWEAGAETSALLGEGEGDVLDMFAYDEPF
jgi:hypothetical protein